MESRRPFIVPLIVGCAQFMHQFDGSVITTALPAMARSLGEDPLRLNLAITCYLLALAVFVPVQCSYMAVAINLAPLVASAGLSRSGQSRTRSAISPRSSLRISRSCSGADSSRGGSSPASTNSRRTRA